MANAFLSFAAEDLDFVLRVIPLLETGGQHRCWYYVRDSNAANAYMEKVTAAIDGCDVFILLISPSSLDSYQVGKEVQLAHDQNKVILPIYLNASSDDLDEQQPGWKLAISGVTYLRVDSDNEGFLIRDMMQVLTEHGPAPVNAPARWAADATLIHLQNLERVLFQTPDVCDFLTDEQKFFVSANKGVGKTLLLKTKRARLETMHSTKAGGRSDVLFLPRDKPYLDNLAGEWPTLRKDKQSFLADLRSSRRLWSMAMRLAFLSHFPQPFSQLSWDRLPSSVRNTVEREVPPKSAVTIVFRSLLTSLTVTEIHSLLDRMETAVEHALRSLHSPIYCFIDTVEQGVSNLGRDAWINLQAGLIEAASDIMLSNNHIKIYASIREEAFANYTSPSKINLYSSVLSLRYSLDELHQMLDSLSRLYERESSFYQFIGRSTVRNLHCRISEDSFRYVHRHTTGRPRDLVVICSEIARERSTSETQFRNTVNRVASSVLLPLVFNEMNVFLDCLHDEEERIRFFKLLSHNVMTRREVETICAAFNGLDDLNFHSDDETGVQIGHPFCELFNCGLIGTVLEDNVEDTVLQQFRQPFDVISQCRSCLPKGDYYLLHPALHSLISHYVPSQRFHVLKYLAVGHRYRWEIWTSELVDLQKAILDCGDAATRNSLFEFLDHIHRDGTQVPEALMASDQMVAKLKDELERKQQDELWLFFDKFVNAFAPLRVNSSCRSDNT